MTAKRKKIRTKKSIKCQCFYGLVCEAHPKQPWKHRAATLQQTSVKIHSATKIRILFFCQCIVRSSREEESRQLKKLCYQVGLTPSLRTTLNFWQLGTQPVLVNFFESIGFRFAAHAISHKEN
jgi:hypothetical protein